MNRYAFLFGLCVCMSILLAGRSPSTAGNPQASATAGDDKANPDEAALRALVADFVKLFNAGDARGLAGLFTEKAEVVTIAGQKIQGRAEIEKQFAAAFSEDPGQVIEVKSESIRFLGPDAAIEEGTATISSPEGTGDSGESAESSRYSTAYVKRDGKWLHDSIRDYPLPSESTAPESAEEHLKELEFLVGEWIDESDDAEVHTTCRWADNKAFLLRSFQVKIRGRDAMVGSQRVGWDPRLKQIRSWVFDSDGGFSDGLWSRDGDRWVIKTSGVLKDGRTASATNILTFVNKDTIKWGSVDRTVGPEILPDAEEITLVRTPPQPRSTRPQPKPAQTERTRP